MPAHGGVAASFLSLFMLVEDEELLVEDKKAKAEVPPIALAKANNRSARKGREKECISSTSGLDLHYCTVQCCVL